MQKYVFKQIVKNLMYNINNILSSAIDIIKKNNNYYYVSF